MPTWEANDHVMLATVPTTRVATWYSALGNWPVLLGLLFIVGAVGLGLRRRQRR
jgi:LPXTG-motif cell wall-anchored protein